MQSVELGILGLLKGILKTCLKTNDRTLRHWETYCKKLNGKQYVKLVKTDSGTQMGI